MLQLITIVSSAISAVCNVALLILLYIFYGPSSGKR